MAIWNERFAEERKRLQEEAKDPENREAVLALVDLDFQERVWDRDVGKCRCGKDGGVKLQLLYPEYLGGVRIEHNATLLCDGCLLRRERGVSEYVRTKWGGPHARVNFEVARDLYKRFQELCEDEGRNASAVLRELMVSWIGVRTSRPAMDPDMWSRKETKEKGQ